MISHITASFLIPLVFYILYMYLSYILWPISFTFCFLIYEVDLNHILYIFLVLYICAVICTIRLNYVRKEIDRLSFRIYKTVDEYEIEKEYYTMIEMEKLRKHPDFPRIKRDIEERRRNTLLNSSSFMRNRGSISLMERNDSPPRKNSILRQLSPKNTKTSYWP